MGVGLVSAARSAPALARALVVLFLLSACGGDADAPPTARSAPAPSGSAPATEAEATARGATPTPPAAPEGEAPREGGTPAPAVAEDGDDGYIDDPSEDGEGTWREVDTDGLIAQAFSSDPALRAAATDAVRAYRAVLDALHSGRQDAYAAGFADRLDCFYGARDAPAERARARADTLCVGGLRVLRASADEVALADLGAWYGRGGGPSAYRKIVVLRRVGRRFLIVAELGERGDCGSGDFALLPARSVVCREAREICRRGCRGYCEDEGFGCDVCTMDCGARHHACMGHAARAFEDGCE